MEMQFDLCAGLTIVENQMLLGGAEDKLDLEAGTEKPEEVFRRQIQVHILFQRRRAGHTRQVAAV